MDYIKNLIERKPHLKNLEADIKKAYSILEACYKQGNKVLICGNGGSSADSGHITGELMKAFKKKRPIDEKFSTDLKKLCDTYEKENNIDSGKVYDSFISNLEKGLPTIDLTAFNALNTAYSNDKNYLFSFANNVLGLGKENDVLIAITTSGNSKNVIHASLVAKAKGMKVIALTGANGGKIKNISDVSIIAPSDETYIIQEDHISIYHALCLELEENLFK